MFDYFEWDMRSLGLAFAFWAFVMLMIWKFALEGMTFPFYQKIIISVISLPLFYIVIQWRLNR